MLLASADFQHQDLQGSGPKFANQRCVPNASTRCTPVPCFVFASGCHPGSVILEPLLADEWH